MQQPTSSSPPKPAAPPLRAPGGPADPTTASAPESRPLTRPESPSLTRPTGEPTTPPAVGRILTRLATDPGTTSSATDPTAPPPSRQSEAIPGAGARWSVGGSPPARPPAGPRRPADLPAVHTSLLCVALPGLAISQDAQLTGRGLDGIYRAGRRLLSRCRIRVAGREPLTVQAQMTSADSARFVATLRASPHSGPDPDIVVERTRRADGTERITLHSTAPRPLRLPLEVALGTDLADLAAIASGDAGPELPATVRDSGLRWTSPSGTCSVTAEPPPSDALASAGLLRWDLELHPGAPTTVELRVRPDGAGPVRAAGRTAASPFAPADADGDDARVQALLRTSVDDLQALLLRDPAYPGDTYLAAGVPWRCGLAPADALAATRMALPLGTRLAAGTLRVLARTQITAPGPRYGIIPGPLRDAGPHLPPSCTATEATLLFPVVLAEARRWGLPDEHTRELLPAAERCLAWLRAAVGDGVYLRDPQPGGPARCETQAHAHRAALLGADLLDAYGRPGAHELRQWAAELRGAFRDEFWADDPGGGRPAAARAPDGGLLTHLGAGAAHLLDTGLLGGGEQAPGLLDRVRTEQLARLLGSPALDSGWGLRGLSAKEAGHNPFGHRSGAVRVHETAVAVAGLTAAGYEKEASSLLRGTLAASEAFGHRLPEMYGGEQRAEGRLPIPHPAACRPAATAAAAGVFLLSTLAGIRPDAVAGTVTLRPMSSAPLGELVLRGLRVAGAPFSVRVSRLGLAMVEEAADGLQLRS